MLSHSNFLKFNKKCYCYCSSNTISMNNISTHYDLLQDNAFVLLSTIKICYFQKALIEISSGGLIAMITMEGNPAHNYWSSPLPCHHEIWYKCLFLFMLTIQHCRVLQGGQNCAKSKIEVKQIHCTYVNENFSAV